MRSGSAAISASARSDAALDVGREHEVDEAFRAARRFLLDAADAQALGNDDRAALRRKIAADEAEQRGLAGAVAPDEPDMRSRGQRRAGVVDQETLAEPIGQGADMEHGGLFARRARAGKRVGSGLLRRVEESPFAIEETRGAGADQGRDDEQP